MVDRVNDSLTEEAKAELANAGETLADEVGDELDSDRLIVIADEVATALAPISSLTRDDLSPELEEQYVAVAESADDIVSHLVSADFFDTADEELPPFDQDFLDYCLVHAVQSVEEEPFETAGVAERLAAIVDEALSHTEEIERNVRWEPEKAEKVSPMTTRGATEGVVDWLDDLGRHLWMSEVLLSDQMLDDASTHTQALGGSILLLAQGAAGLADPETDPEDDVAKVVGAIAVHTHYQRRLPEDLSWITDEMRSPGAWAGD